VKVLDIPIVDLRAQHASIAEDVERAVRTVMEKGDFILGHDVETFEAEFACYCEVSHAVGVDSGLSALELGMRALGIGPGDEVITPANSFIASSSAISFVGAIPVWVDVDPDTHCIDVGAARRAIGSRTRAIMAVHLYGHPAEMDQVRQLAQEYGVKVVEDACQAHGARYRGRRAGSLGDFAAFSFYPAKNLGAYGDAGILTTNDEAIAESVRVMRNYGQRRKYDHATLAWNRRLDTIQAAVLRVKLRHLDGWNQARRKHAGLYSRLLGGTGLTLPVTRPGVEHVFHQYVLQVPDRDRLMSELARRGIGTGVHYPVPIHLQEAYSAEGPGPGSFPVTEAAAQHLVSLPMFPELRPDQVERVAEEVIDVIGSVLEAHP
jgi:dTDP-4-amino-4,6-dideoxygalactose transaminase